MSIIGIRSHGGRDTVFLIPQESHIGTLKLKNILLSEDYQPTVTDFGFAGYIGSAKDQRKRSTTFCGSYSYVAPAILQGTSPRSFD